MPIDQFLIAHAQMLAEIRQLRSNSAVGSDHEAMLDLLEVVEGGSSRSDWMLAP
jgi:hypothetical protein